MPPTSFCSASCLAHAHTHAHAHAHALEGAVLPGRRALKDSCGYVEQFDTLVGELT